MQEILELEDEAMLKKYQNQFSPEAHDLLTQLLKQEPSNRIGCREAGVYEIKFHPFFNGIDWELIDRKGMVAPFIPSMKDGPVDISNISEEFTQMSLDQTPEMDSRLTEMMGEEA